MTDHACENGWLFAASGVYPCDRCRPGAHALWRAGLLHRGWEGREYAVRTYIAAMLEAGQPLPPKPPGPPELWRRAMSDLTRTERRT